MPEARGVRHVGERHSVGGAWKAGDLEQARLCSVHCACMRSELVGRLIGRGVSDHAAGVWCMKGWGEREVSLPVTPNRSCSQLNRKPPIEQELQQTQPKVSHRTGAATNRPPVLHVVRPGRAAGRSAAPTS